MSAVGRLRAAALAALTAVAAAVSAPAALADTDVQVVTSPGGITAWLVEEPSIPILALEMRFEGGASRDPADQTGAAGFMASMLREGAGDLDAAAFEAASDDIALRMGFGAGGDAFTVSARMLTETRAESLALLKLAMTRPRFDADAMERVRGGILASIRSRETDAGALASRAWRSALFGDDPYARRSTAEGVLALTAEDLEAARLRAMNRSRLSVAVVGDITAEELGPLLDDLLLDLPDAPWTPLPRVELSSERGIEVIDLDVPQSSARLLHEGIPRDDPDFVPAFVMNYILGGGGFSSRLTVEVRQKRGLTYGVGSGLANFDRASLMIASLSSSNDRIAEALDVIKAEWTRMRDGGVTAQELEDAKRYLTGAYPLRFDSNARIAGQLVGLMSLGFTPDYIKERNGLIEAVTLDDVARVAKRLLRPDRLHVVVVGRPEGLGDG
ncbi:MAG: pitrilysin family protein [Pseudomonadota bacterium]